jgi:hypothetical protein
MFTRSLTRPALVAALLAGFAFGVSAQTKAPSAEGPAKDKSVAEASFSKADANADGKLSKDEAAKLPAIATRFDELDKNKDGILSPDEFAAGFATN